MNPAIPTILEQIQQTKRISRSNYSQLVFLILSNQMNPGDRSRLNQILDKMQLGQISLI